MRPIADHYELLWVEEYVRSTGIVGFAIRNNEELQSLESCRVSETGCGKGIAWYCGFVHVSIDLAPSIAMRDQPIVRSGIYYMQKYIHPSPFSLQTTGIPSINTTAHSATFSHVLLPWVRFVIIHIARKSLADMPARLPGL